MTSHHPLQDVLALAARSGSLDDCLSGLADRLNPDFAVDRVIVGVLHPDGERLVLVGVWTSDTSQFREGATVRLDATSFHDVAKGGQSVLRAGDVHVNDLPVVEQLLWVEGIRSALSIPLREHGTAAGIVMFCSRSGDAVPSHLLLFETIGLLFEATLLRLGRARLQEQLRADSAPSPD